MRTIVIYHGGGCADGFCSAWLFSKAFPDAEFIACNYGDPVPDVYNARVFVLDFSWKRPEMVGLIEKAYSVVVLDHHPTAADELAGLQEKYAAGCGNPPVIVFDMEKSGAMLAHDWLRNNITDDNITDLPPWIVQYVQDRDLWTFALPHSRAINTAIRTYPHEFEAWDKLCSRGAGSDRGALITEGEAILRADAQIVRSHVKNAREINLDGHQILAVNATALVSEIAGELAAGRPFGACFFDRLEPDGGYTRVWSLRVRDGAFDVGKLAQKFGGGGHVKAAGFQVRL